MTRIYHHLEDGMWVFFGDIDVGESDYKVISVEEMIDLDNSMLSLSSMEPGYFAYRVSGRDNFVIKKISSDT